MIDWTVQIGSLRLANPILVASGTFGYGVEFRQAVPVERLGAIITKTLTREPRAGNAPPRLIETSSGMLNSVGLHNMGLSAFLKEKLPLVRQLGVPIIVSIWAETVEEADAMVRPLDAADGVAAIELNLSCPNLTHASNGGALVAQDADATAAFVAAARRATRKPVIAKLTPDVTDIRPIARAAESAGADAIALVNTFAGMSIDPATRRSRLGASTGGLSGPAIRPLAVYRVWQVHHVVRCPIIGLGGIVSAEDALEFFIAGASAVAIGTANFANPRATMRVLRGLERYLTRHKLASLRDLVGTFQPSAPTPAAAAP